MTGSARMLSCPCGVSAALAPGAAASAPEAAAADPRGGGVADPYSDGRPPGWLGWFGGTYLGGTSARAADWDQAYRQASLVPAAGWNALRMRGMHTVWVPPDQPITTEPALARFADVVVGKYPDGTDVLFRDVPAVAWVRDEMGYQLPAAFRLGRLGGTSKCLVAHEAGHGLDVVNGYLSSSQQWLDLHAVPRLGRDAYRTEHPDEDWAETLAEVLSTKPSPAARPDPLARYGNRQEVWQYFLDLMVIWGWM